MTDTTGQPPLELDRDTSDHMPAELGPSGQSSSDQQTYAPDALADGIGPPPIDDRIEIRSMRVEGRDVVVKAASSSARAALRRESEVLERLSSERVVQLGCIREGADHTELTTLRHGTVSLAEVGLLGYEHRGRALVSTCTALDALHEAGWTHGSLEPSHVLVDAEGQVRFCSLGSAEQTATATRTSVPDDREALDSIVRAALESEGGFGSARERRSWRRSSARALRSLSTRRGLLDGSTTAAVLRESKVPGTLETDGSDTGSGVGTGCDLENRPSRPVIRRRGQHAAAGSRDRSAGWRSWGPVALIPGALIALVAGVATARLFDPDAPTPPGRCEVELAGSVLECDEVRIEDNTVHAGTERFEVGESGDDVAVGDWNCDGLATVLLMDLDDGALWEFRRWAAPGQPEHGSLVGTFSGATGLVEDPPECAYPDVVVGERR